MIRLPCKHHGCPNSRPSGVSFCEAHKDEEVNRQEVYDRTKRHKGRPWMRLYGTAQWQRRRLRQLNKEPTCRMCAAKGVLTGADVADHIVPVDSITSFWKGKLQSLCTHCHGVKHRKARTR